MDANCLSSLALPRAVAPYTTVRQTTYISDAHKTYLFGTFAHVGNTSNNVVDENTWSNALCVTPIDSSLAVQTALNTKFYYGAGLGGTGSAIGRISMAPACITVNISNGQPLQTTAGMIYVGRMDQPSDWRSSGSS